MVFAEVVSVLWDVQIRQAATEQLCKSGIAREGGRCTAEARGDSRRKEIAMLFDKITNDFIAHPELFDLGPDRPWLDFSLERMKNLLGGIGGIFDINNIESLPEKRKNKVIEMAHAAPLFPPYSDFWLEYRSPDGISVAYQVAPSIREKCFSVCLWRHNPLTREVAFNEIGEFSCGDDFSLSSSILWFNENWLLQKGVEIPLPQEEIKSIGRYYLQSVTMVIALLNWEPDIIPREKLDLSRANEKRNRDGKSPLSEPTILNIAQLVRYISEPQGGTHASPLLHPVRFHRRIVSPLRPLFGRLPIAGVTCGVFRIKPHRRGNPARGIKNPGRYTFRPDDPSSAG